MSYEVRIVEDSLSKQDMSRLTTFQLRYPRFVHAEFMTHRVFSRNASSSRAIPVEKMISMVRNEPAMPCHWGKNQKGMQAEEELNEAQQKFASMFWNHAAKSAADTAEMMMELGLHKQVANRILEPFQWMSVVVTATNYDNFFSLRCHKDAEPNIQKLAYLMKAAYKENKPNLLNGNDYHLPYVSQAERAQFNIQELTKFSVARCARVSYLTHDGENPSPEKDIELYERLVGGIPMHASPTEHQARPATTHLTMWKNGNFTKGWAQYRKFLEKDEVFKFNSRQ